MPGSSTEPLLPLTDSTDQATPALNLVELKVTPRVRRKLALAGIDDIEGLCRFSWIALLKLPSMGSGDVRAVEGALAAAGYTLAQPPPTGRDQSPY